MNTIYCVFNSFSIDRFVERQINVDFQLGSVKYFRNEYLISDVVDEDFVNYINHQSGFDDGGGVYAGEGIVSSQYEGQLPEEFYDGWYNDETGGIVSVYSMDEFVLSKLEFASGSFDREKFAVGKYVLIGVYPDDYEAFDVESALYHPGDKIKLDFMDGDMKMEKEYEVMGLYLIKNTNSERGRDSYLTVTLPHEELMRSGQEPKLMTYIFNINKGYSQQFEKIIQNYIQNGHSAMHYESKDTFRVAFLNFKRTIAMIGSLATMILLVIGVMNYMNSIYTGIVSRKYEFAIMKSIGMEGRQLKGLLGLESAYYILLAVILSFVMSIVIIYVILIRLSDVIWFFEFEFSVLPLMIAYAMMGFISLRMPNLLSRKDINSSIIEEIRNTEY